MQVGFQQSQQGFEGVDRFGDQSLPKVHGKYFRDQTDSLMQPIKKSDPNLPWHKESAFLWDINGKRMKFVTKESTEKAIESGNFFTSPALAKSALDTKVRAEKEELKRELEMRKELAELRKAEAAASVPAVEASPAVQSSDIEIKPRGRKAKAVDAESVE